MVAIKDMEMPKGCVGCDFCSDDWCCKIQHKYINNFVPNHINRDPNCPLVEIQERKVGKWIGDKAYPICFKCNCNIIEEYISCSDYAEMYKPMKYCPNCGAEMRGGENE